MGRTIKCLMIVFMSVIILQIPTVYSAENKKEDSVLYFNSGAEKYLQGNYAASVEDLEKLRQLKNKQSTKALLDLAGIIPKGSGLPADLSKKHNEYTWD